MVRLPSQVDSATLTPERAEAYSNRLILSSADIASAPLTNNLADTDSSSDTAPEVDPSTFLTEGGGVTEEGVRWEGKKKQEKVRGREENEAKKRKKQT